MSAFNIDKELIKAQIQKTSEMLNFYTQLYNSENIKCITLKRLISIKQNELSVLEKISQEQN